LTLDNAPSRERKNGRSTRAPRHRLSRRLVCENGRNKNVPLPAAAERRILTIERRRDPRTEVNLGLFVWSVETKGERFLQEARARDISLNGALLSGIDTDVRPGDVVGILFLGIEARYRVVWVLYAQGAEKMQVAVSLIEPDACPWQHLLASPALAQAAGAN
jgi:hypothetical protein